MDSFLDLHSTDQQRFINISNVLTQIFNITHIEKDHIYRYDTKMETPENHKIILDNWNMLFFDEKQPERCKKNHRLVFWMLEHVVQIFNEKHKPTQPIKFDKIQFTKRLANNGKKPTAITYYELRF